MRLNLGEDAATNVNRDGLLAESVSHRNEDAVNLRLLFVEKPHPYIRSVITSLLAGTVFARNARWAEDARTRLTRAGLTQLLDRA